MIRKRLKRLLAFTLIIINVMSTVIAFAADGMTGEPIEGAGYLNIGTTVNYLNLYSGDTINLKQVDNSSYYEFPVISYDYGDYVTTENLPDLSVYQDLVDKITLFESNDSNFNKTLGELNSDLVNLLDSMKVLAPNIDFSYYYDYITGHTEDTYNSIYYDFSGQVNNYSVSLDAKMYREGYHLASYSLKEIKRTYCSAFDVYLAEYVYQPVWVPDGVFYGTCEQLEVNDLILPGSIVYATANCAPCFYTNLGEYSEIISNNVDDVNPIVTNHWRSSELLMNFGNKQVMKIKGTCNGENVACWKITSIRNLSLMIYSNLSSFVVSDDNGATQVTHDLRRRNPYVSGESKLTFYELEPITEDPMLLASPTVSMNGYELIISAGIPVSQYGTVDYSDKVSEIKNYFYVTEPSVSNVTKESNASDFTLFKSTDSHVLHAGEYKVWKYSTYTDNNNNTIETDLDYEVITVEPPVLTAPTINVPTGCTEGMNVIYVANNITTNNNITDYSSYRTDQKVQHYLSVDKNFDESTLNSTYSTSTESTASDIVKAGYNKVFCRSSFTVPASMFGEQAITYYSPVASETVYSLYNLNELFIQEELKTIKLSVAEEDSDLDNIEIRYLYEDSLATSYDNKTADQIMSVSSVYTEPIVKLDGISKLYAFAVYEEVVGDTTYTSYGPVKKVYCRGAYDIKDTIVSAMDSTVELSTGGYSSELKSYDSSKIYYLKTDKVPTDSEIASIVSSNNVYTGPIDKGYGGYYITAKEVVISNDGNTSITSLSTPTTKYVGTTTVSVSLDAQGGSCDKTGLICTYGSPYGVLPIPSKTGYTFECWMLDLNDSTSVIEADNVVNQKTQHTLYAKYSPISYNVKYCLGDVSTMPITTMVYDDASTLEKNQYQMAYTVSFDYATSSLINDSKTIDAKFLGWSLNSDDDTISYVDEASVQNLSSNPNDTVLLSAKFSSENLTLPTPIRSGYTCTAWSYNNNLFNCGDTIKISSDMTLKAIWEANTYRVSFDANEGECDIKSKQVKMNATYGELPIPKRAGYSFIDWYSKSDEVITEDTIKKTAENETLYAEWEENSYLIHFDANGGRGEMKDLELLYTESDSLTRNSFKRDGYTFIGWNTDPQALVIKYKDGAVVSELAGDDIDTVTLYAIWKRNAEIKDEELPELTPAEPEHTEISVTKVERVIENVKTGDSATLTLACSLFSLGFIFIAVAVILMRIDIRKRKSNTPNE